MDKFVKEAWLENGSGSMFVFVRRWAFWVTEYLTKGNDHSYISEVLDDRALARFPYAFARFMHIRPTVL